MPDVCSCLHIACPSLSPLLHPGVRQDGPIHSGLSSHYESAHSILSQSCEEIQQKAPFYRERSKHQGGNHCPRVIWQGALECREDGDFLPGLCVPSTLMVAPADLGGAAGPWRPLRDLSFLIPDPSLGGKDVEGEDTKRQSCGQRFARIMVCLQAPLLPPGTGRERVKEVELMEGGRLAAGRYRFQFKRVLGKASKITGREKQT